MASWSRLAYRSRTRRSVVASAVFTRDRTGVMPLPALKATTSRSPAPSRKNPAGRLTSTTAPGTTWSLIQLDTGPPGTRLTVTRSSSSTAGAEDIE